MVEVVTYVVLATVSFCAGAVYGDLRKSTVDQAIAALKAAEASAAATLAKITAHKAS